MDKSLKKKLCAFLNKDLRNRLPGYLRDKKTFVTSMGNHFLAQEQHFANERCQIFFPHVVCRTLHNSKKKSETNYRKKPSILNPEDFVIKKTGNNV